MRFDLKVPLLITLFLLPPTLLLAQLDRDEIERQRIVAGKVKVAEQYIHKYVNGKPNADGYLAARTTYDRKGNPIEVINYRASGEESSRLYYKYNAKGYRTEYRKEEPWTDEATGKRQMKLFFKQVFTYDAKGNKKTESGFDGMANYRILYSYLPNGKLSSITKYNSDNSVGERWIYTYNGPKQTVNVTPKSGQPYRMEKEYDGKGRLISDRLLSSDQKEKRLVRYTYDKQGRILTETTSLEGVLKYTLRYVFDSKGQLLEVVQRQPSGDELQNSAYKYDANGNLVEEKWIENDPALISEKESSYSKEGDLNRVESYYAPYRYRVMYSYRYEKF